MDCHQNPMHLLFLYDPMCGWCYGAVAAVGALARDGRFEVEPLPTGLYAGDPSRRIDPHFSDHIQKADARIERLSGQPFSEAYRRNVLGNAGLPFDSGPATEALTAVCHADPTAELEALHAIQRERYVHGHDITDREVLAQALAGSVGGAPEDWHERLEDPDLEGTAGARVMRARALLETVGARGVPALVWQMPEGGLRLLPPELMFDRQPLAERLEPFLGPVLS
jgi:putative protein-disulfide isomerase